MAVQLGGLLAGCGDQDPCEAAKERLDSCESEIQEAVEQKGHASLPLAFTGKGECTGRDRCVAECIDGASCSELAEVVTGSTRITDPNAEPVATAPRFKCVIDCLSS